MKKITSILKMNSITFFYLLLSSYTSHRQLKCFCLFFCRWLFNWHCHDIFLSGNVIMYWIVYHFCMVFLLCKLYIHFHLFSMNYWLMCSLHCLEFNYIIIWIPLTYTNWLITLVRLVCFLRWTTGNKPILEHISA